MLRSVATRVIAATAALLAVTVSAPQAVAADTPQVRISSKADAATRAFAQSEPQAVEAAANVCGAGYDLLKGTPLPLGTEPSMRLGTLFTYISNTKACAILDNNVGISQYMYLKVCAMGGTGCTTDSGNFSQYAGPVYVSDPLCAPVTARMGKTASTLYINYQSDYAFVCN